MAYRVKKAFEQHRQLTTVIDGKRVALVEAYTHETKGTPTKPPEKISVPLATQVQLKAIFERGDPCVEQYEETKTPEIRNTLADYVPKNPFQGVTPEMLDEAKGKKKTTVKNEPE